MLLSSIAVICHLFLAVLYGNIIKHLEMYVVCCSIRSKMWECWFRITMSSMFMATADLQGTIEIVLILVLVLKLMSCEVIAVEPLR